MQTIDYKYIIKRRASRKIFTFYSNVAKKYRHTYDKEDLKRDIQNAVFSIYGIERTLLRREPTLARWNGYHMANTDKWYFPTLSITALSPLWTHATHRTCTKTDNIDFELRLLTTANDNNNN